MSPAVRRSRPAAAVSRSAEWVLSGLGRHREQVGAVDTDLMVDRLGVSWTVEQDRYL